MRSDAPTVTPETAVGQSRAHPLCPILLVSGPSPAPACLAPCPGADGGETLPPSVGFGGQRSQRLLCSSVFRSAS